MRRVEECCPASQPIEFNDRTAAASNGYRRMTEIALCSRTNRPAIKLSQHSGHLSSIRSPEIREPAIGNPEKTSIQTNLAASRGHKKMTNEQGPVTNFGLNCNLCQLGLGYWTLAIDL
ncbi:hypothetical protein Pla144_05000 [Bythopirellula polymerisocia]|uniref:Uncharacterized protein n=1 Tax=Bythopirellula polymerisocia TaxID=2528003 RepID=A0A5C6D1T2_9BACT|nr:hypothetical protein Pla144_05000 [Bythopirellula polymerisocia]